MAPPPRALALKERLLLVDLAALALALASGVILVAARTTELSLAERRWLTVVDFAAILLFALLFVGKALASDSPPRYMRRHFFDAFGLLPITTPVLGLDRWWTLVGLLIVLARGSAALDRAFGERVLARVFERYRSALVEELTEPILVRLLAILREALSQGRYTASVGLTIEERRADVHEIVRKSIAASPKLAFVRGLPGVGRKLDESVDEIVTSAVTALTSEEMNRLVAEAISRALTDLEREIQKPQWKGRGLGIGDVARGFMPKV